VTEQEALVQERLTGLGIAFERFEHPPIATAEEGQQYWAGIDAVHSKNLFVRNQKGTRHYLVIVVATKRADLRAVASQIGDGKLSFASPERLRTYLGLEPGSVSPFGLINDRERHVQVFIDQELRSAARVSFHPNRNTATLTLTVADFERFLIACGNSFRYIMV
jgi:Ala-tRNA(Pro) deacylase